jgi:hypothetical protein
MHNGRDGGLVALAALTLALFPGHLTAQDVDALAARCASSDPTASAICREAALALQAAQGDMGLLAAGGAQIPGSSSSLGRRFGGMPRLSGSLKAGVARLEVPDVRSASGPATGRSYTGFATQASLAVGVLDGFSLVPTVGGVLSLDVFATLGALVLPDGAGYQEGSSQWGVGANLGLLRESFTVPGVSVAVARRSLGEAQLGNRAAGDAVQISLDPAVTSVRGVVGKDLLSFGVLAGIGWDRYSSDAVLIVPGLAGAARQTAVDGFTADRTLGFAGLSLSLLVLQISAEAGWAKGFETVSGRPEGGFDPEGSSLFLSVAGRLTL